jgi:hypothetical protein
MMPKTWFVTFRPKDARLLPDGHRRTSKRFDSEADAKAFALDRLADSTQITAGTINPFAPKRFIGSAGIRTWLDR